MNCCDEYGDCQQGRNCPIRTGYGHRKVRAGKPVSDDTGCLPVQYTKEQIDDWEVDDRAAAREFLIMTVLVALLFAVLAALLFDLMGV
jgi:sensor histidine kinase regulating citrate/malate metabolism